MDYFYACFVLTAIRIANNPITKLFNPLVFNFTIPQYRRRMLSYEKFSVLFNVCLSTVCVIVSPSFILLGPYHCIVRYVKPHSVHIVYQKNMSKFLTNKIKMNSFLYRQNLLKILKWHRKIFYQGSERAMYCIHH